MVVWSFPLFHPFSLFSTSVNDLFSVSTFLNKVFFHFILCPPILCQVVLKAIIIIIIVLFDHFFFFFGFFTFFFSECLIVTSLF